MYGKGRSVAASAFRFASIHPSAWKENSAKFISRILHRTPSEGPEDGYWGHPRNASEIYMLWFCIDILRVE